MSRHLGRVLAPLVAGRTWRGWAHLILGGALLVPFWLLMVVVVGATLAPAEGGGGGLAFLVGSIILVLPGAWLVGFLIPTFRTVEVVAARDLLDAPIDDLEGDARSGAARRRTGTWVALHLGIGGIMSGLSLAVPPGALYLLAWPVTHDEQRLADLPLQVTGWIAPMAGLVLLAAQVYLVAGASAVLGWAAPRLLGPTPEDRVAALEREADKLAERNRLARELHDSVGHALSIITVQAGAAQRVQGSDPGFVDGALGAIEDSARRALEDLDHVLGMLRDDAEASTRPLPTLADLDRLVATTRGAGVQLEAEVSGPLGGVPPVVSREAYRIVQEGLTNAVRHAGRVPVTLRVAVEPDRLDLEVTNPVADGSSPVGAPLGAGLGEPLGSTGGPSLGSPLGSPLGSSLGSALGSPGGAAAGGGPGTRRRRTGGRGLRGIRERVTVLRGEMSAGAQDGRWRLAVSLPLRSPR